MEIELQEIRDFLAGVPPFDELPDETLDSLPEQLEIRYLRRGETFPPKGAGAALWLPRSGAIELRDAAGRLLARIGEGATIDDCLAPPPRPTGEAIEDSLLYCLPCAALRRLGEHYPTLERHFSISPRERMRRALETAGQDPIGIDDDLGAEVATLLKHPPVTIDASASIQQAAQRMSEERVSSLLVMRNECLAGIVTDSDLRRRVVAPGRDPGEPVGEIVSSDVHSIPPDASLMRAMLTMTRLRVHHLPVIDGDGRLLGLLSDGDITRRQTINPVFLASDIARADSLDELIAASRALPELQLRLASANASARHIGESISCLTDAICRRLLELGEQRFGAPPAPYLWLAGGSQARGEQSAHSDQDNAMILSDATHADELPWFEDLARFVSDGLNACGYVYCPGDAMATNPEWRQPLATWRGYFDRWIGHPEPKALMLSSIFFDLKPIHGDESLFESLHAEVLEKPRANTIFIAHLTANALSHRPPLGFFRNFVLIHDGKHDDTLDIKHRGLAPIVDIARIVALAEGLAPIATDARLRAAMGSPSLSREMGRNLRDALEFIARLRFRHQARQIRAGVVPDNYLPPAELSQLERSHLKDAFRIIQSMQELLEHRYQVGRLG